MADAVLQLDALTIGEAARRVGLTPRAVRYYERIGLVQAPPRGGHNNYRLYDQEAVRELRFIARCRAIGLSVAEIRALSSGSIERTRGGGKAAMVRAQLRLTEARIRELLALRRELRRLLAVRAADAPQRRAASLRSVGGKASPG